MSSGAKINLLTLAILAVVFLGAAPHLHQIHWTARRIAGAAMMAVAFAGVIAARFQLGAAFSIQAHARKLVTTGLYARVRNPIYVCGEVLIVGIALVTGRWFFVAIAAALLPVQVRRARNEARVLREAFGEEYERYRARTWF
ncbi:MAG TPA: isoprenylcysteine carboxylmethyltransferase family protein [Acidobacteriaceae bacterium]|nr:isoprenylcysteine carboxylmethyltransferase family protein [Acidobacteriaceae bacterium]